MSGPDESTIDVVRKATRELARKFGYGYWREKDKLGEYPWEFVKAFARGGWLGALIPEAYGGLGFGLAECGVMMQEIAASGAGASGASAVHFYLFPPAPIISYGSEEMKLGPIRDDLAEHRRSRRVLGPPAPALAGSVGR
jgi:alkylation response protein AidB-like acyl-CoA dehydrogenase